MITDPIELAVQRDLTRAFIAADQDLIVLIPQVEIKTPTGGRTTEDGTPRDAQAFHFSERNSTARTATRVPGGEMREEEYTLIGNWDAIVEVKDRFSFGGAEWQVAALERENGYERRAAVIRYGR